MKHSNDTGSSAQKHQSLLTLCRFLAVRFVYRTMLVLPVVSGFFLAFAGRTQFAPFGIALVCLILPLFLNDAVTSSVKKENNESSLSSLYQRYRYSSVLFLSYRITLTLEMLLLLIWHKVQAEPVLLFGCSLPLLFIVLCLALCPLLGRILFFRFHRRLMSGSL
ncbi:MAG: hypothetical protein IJD26_09710 [Lachnospiraceae bacterium]|nr:hypothetical protein [Lachnospiraceae bacterium]